MTEFDDERLIRSLRSAGTDGPTFAMTSLDETTRRGRAARRRRTILAGAGATALAAATVTAALALPPLLNGPDVVPAPAIDPPNDSTQEPDEEPSAEADEAEAATPMTSGEMIAASKTAAFEALPDGFVRLTEENEDDANGMAGFALAENAPATDGLPDGMSAGIDLTWSAASRAIDITGDWCEGRTAGTVTTDCVEQTVGGETVHVQQWSQPGSTERRAYESTRTTYERPDGDFVVLDVQAWEDEGTTTPRSEAARAWVDSMHEQVVGIVLDPSFRPSEWDERNLADVQDLAADLGDGWRVNETFPAGIYPSDELTEELPGEVSPRVVRDVVRDADLSALCAARTEGGVRHEACEPIPETDAVVSYGVMDDPEHGGDGSTIADVTVYDERADGSIVEVRLTVSGHTPSTSPDPPDLRPWLEEQVPDLVRAATSGW